VSNNADADGLEMYAECIHFETAKVAM